MRQLPSDRVRELYHAGLKQQEIAQQLGYSVVEVRAHMHQLGLHRTNRRTDLPHDEIVRTYRAGSSTEDLAKRFRCSPRAIQYRLLEAGVEPRDRRKRADIDTDKVVQMWRAGMAVAEIARGFNCQEQLIRWRLRMAGVVLQPPRPADRKPRPRPAPRPPRRGRTLTARQLEAAQIDPFGPSVLGETFVVCLECGRTFRALGSHLLRKHHTTVEEYKEGWGYNRTQALMSAELIEQFQEQTRRLIAAGRIPGNSLEGCPGVSPKGQPKRPQTLPQMRERLKKMVRRGAEHSRTRTDVTFDEIRPLLEAGLNSVQIAERLQCSKYLVLSRMRGAGMHLDRGRRDVAPEVVAKMYRAGQSIHEIAAELDCGLHTVKSRLDAAGIKASHRPTRRDLTPEAVTAAWESGMSWEQMAEAFHCGEATILDRLRKAGVKLGKNLELKRPDITAPMVAEARKEGITLREMAERFGCSLPLIRDRLREAGVPIRPVSTRMDITEAEVLRRWERGESEERMARELRCSRSVIHQRLKSVRGEAGE